MLGWPSERRLDDPRRTTPILSASEELVGGPLASLMRGVRVANPYPGEATEPRALWEEQSQINLPFLVLAALELPKTNLAFVQRDCCHLQPLHRALSGETNVSFHASRLAYERKGEALREYVEATAVGRTIVDLCASGRSTTAYFRETFQRTPEMIIVVEGRETVRHPSIATLADRGVIAEHCDFHPFVEYFNCSRLGTIRRWPKRARCEYPRRFLDAQHGAIEKAIECLPWHPGIPPDREALSRLIPLMPGSRTVEIIPHALDHRPSRRNLLRRARTLLRR